MIMIIIILVIVIIVIDPQPVDLLPSTLAEYEAALPDLPRDRVLAIFRCDIGVDNDDYDDSILVPAIFRCLVVMVMLILS